jgi:hypothetical protein
LFNTWRETTPTALAHFLPGSFQLGLTILAAITILAAAVYAHRATWSYGITLAYVLIAITAVLISGKVFLNNYVLWLLPFMGLTLAAAFEQATEASITASDDGRSNRPV